MLCRCRYETMVKKCIDLVYNVLVRTEVIVCFQCCNHCVSFTGDRWKLLKVICGILIVVVVVIIALIRMLWWLPLNGKTSFFLAVIACNYYQVRCCTYTGCISAVDCGTLPDPVNGRVSHTAGIRFGNTLLLFALS